MPYHIGEKGTHGCKGYPVVKDSDGEVMGCHTSRDKAKKQLAALYINEPEASKAASASGFVAPANVRTNARRGLELRKKFGRGGTAVGIARARDIANGSALSLSTIKRMNSFFARHEVDKKGKDWNNASSPSNGKIAWLLWGGDAGWSWAKKIIRQQENKEKSTMANLTTQFFGIEKADKNSDGTLTVYGKATDDSLDIDQQICDADWLKRAMPHWFQSGGNIREQHSNIAAGVAKEYEVKEDGHYITALVVDPVSVKKVENGVLKGFSIGIKNPRVTRDKSAANGRIIDGQIVEVSLVDRPANPNCQLVLAKSVNGEDTVIQVEELIEKEDKKPNYENMLRGGGKSEPADKELYAEVVRDAKKKFDVYPSAVANAWVVREYKKRGGTYKKKTEKGADTLELPDMTEREAMNILAEDVIELSKAYAGGDLLKFDKKTYDSARQALAQLIAIEAEELGDGHNEESSLSHLLAAVHHLFAWYAGEEAEGEVMEETVEAKAAHEKEMKPKKGEKRADFMARCKEAGMADDDAKKCWDKYLKSIEIEIDEDEEEETEEKAKKKSADVSKCLECGCNQVGSDHGLTQTNDFANVAKPSNVTTAEMYSPDQTPKSAEADVAEVKAEEAAPAEAETPAEEVKEEQEISADAPKSADITAIVEQAIKSATESIKSEIAELMTAKEAAESKATRLETELAEAKSLAVAGGPKRTAKPVAETSNDLLTKAAAYNAKAQATTDPTLAKGYTALAKEFLAKAQTDSK